MVVFETELYGKRDSQPTVPVLFTLKKLFCKEKFRK